MGEFAEFAELATQVMARCETLGTLSQDPACLDRRYLTEQHKLASQLPSQVHGPPGSKCRLLG